jgi:hypothetical protein
MTDLTKKEESLPESLDDLKALSKAQNAGLEHLSILMDSSGSMDGFFKSERIPKWEMAKKALKMLWDKTDWGISETTLFIFEESCRKDRFDANDPPNPEKAGFAGGTDFGPAINMALVEECDRIILCSDGESQFPESQIQICKDKNIPIDTIFIASDCPSKGEEMLMKISESTNGQFTTVEDAESLIHAFQMLETSERLLLTHDASEEAIEL